MTRIVLVRHGEVPGISPERFRGRASLRLTEHGLAQARTTAKRIAERWRPALIYTSPLQRCVQTGQMIADACDRPALVLDDLNDIDYGAWTGRSHEEVRERAPLEYQQWRIAPDLVRFPAGESLQDLSTRAADALRFVTTHQADDTVVLVGHDSSNRAILLHALGLPLSAYWRIAQSPCGISEIVMNQDHPSLLRMNETAHLEIRCESIGAEELVS
jgi:broad specificity phosphatase PhoE